MIPRLALFAVVFLAAGCGSGPKIYSVKGTVTWQGKPLPRGVVFFEADPRQGNTGPQGYAIINDGEYTTTGEMGRGVVGGAYIIKIDGFDGKPGAELPMGKPLFSGYEELRVFDANDQVQNFEVKK